MHNNINSTNIGPLSLQQLRNMTNLDITSIRKKKNETTCRWKYTLIFVILDELTTDMCV